MGTLKSASDGNAMRLRRSRCARRVLAVAVTATSVAAAERCEAAANTLTAVDAVNNSSFAGGPIYHWNGGNATPSAGNTYEVSGNVALASLMRAYGLNGNGTVNTGLTGNSSFGGTSLQIDDGADLLLKTNGTVTVSGNGTAGTGLILNGGVLEVDGIAGTGTFAGNITLNSGVTSYIVGSNTSSVAITAPITGSGNLTINGHDALWATNSMTSGVRGDNPVGSSNGTITLAASNSYTGITTITGGTLSLNNTNALAGGGNITFAGGTLQFTGNNINDYSTNIVNSGNHAIAIDTNGQNVTFAGVLSSTNTGGLTKIGAGTLYLPNTGSGGEYTGGVILSGGTLNVDGIDGLGQAPGSAAVAITFAGNSTLQFATGFSAFSSFNFNRITSIPAAGVTGTIDTNGFSNMTAGQQFIGNGTLGKAGNGTLTLTGTNNTYAGGTIITGGTLRANSASGSATGTGNITVAAGASGNYTGGMLGGGGNVSGTVTLLGSATAEHGGIIGAGADAGSANIGTLTTGNQTWNGGGAYEWKISGNGTGTTGSGSTVADFLQVGNSTSGSPLTIVTASGGFAPFTIAPLGNLTNVTNSSYSWNIAQIGSGNATTISLDTATTGNSTTPLYGGTNNANFALDTSGLTINGSIPSPSSFALYFETVSGNNDLVLTYNAAPEPGTALLAIFGALPLITTRRRRRRAPT